MSNFGETLKQERERRGTSLDELSASTEIGREYLEALERGEIGALPGPAFGKLYIRAYAERLGFDPEPLLADYENEVLRLQRERPGGIARRRFTPRVPAEEALPAPAAPSGGEGAEVRRPARLLPRLAWVAATVVLLGSAWVYRVWLPPELPVPTGAGDPVVTSAPAPPPHASEVESRPELPAAAPRLTIEEARVGRRVVGRNLEGEDDQFAAGEFVYFWNRVVDGRTGDSIRHVWLRDGQRVASMELALGGPHWRTHSKLALRGSGRWAVEARDREGHVLARVDFTCD